jgi:dimethylamine--corrinoid protein Co-methyltransferase
MRIDDAKKYVAKKLGISVAELTDDVLMREVRQDLKIGVIRSLPGLPKGVEAKHHISRLLGIEINSLRVFRERLQEV